MVQAGPKTQLGGVKPGFSSVGYYVLTLPTVASPPTADAGASGRRGSRRGSSITADGSPCTTSFVG